MIKWNKVIVFLLTVIIILAGTGLTFQYIVPNITLGLDLKGGFEILYQVVPEEGKVDRDLLISTKQVLDRRISILGVAEPEIDIEGTDRIRIKLAGVEDQAEARRILATEAKLTFRAPDGKILLTGKDLKENGARMEFDSQTNQPVVAITFKNAKDFEDVTRDYYRQPVAIYLDEDMVTNPVIQAVISNGSAVISGQRSIPEAQELASLLNAGALPAALNEISSNSVGASLGQMAMEKGVYAGIIATIFIFLFMLVFYRLPGFIAIVTLVSYVYLVLLFMVLMGATLTLPGIAAFILGIGMAVDANIITYERIKDEIRSGKTLLSSFRAGQRRSFATILDANLTTIIAGIVLFIFGTSAIKGFAVILILGIVVSMITAVGLSRLLLNMIVRSNWLNKPAYYGVKESEIGEL